jgi:hypothetical protein
MSQDYLEPVKQRVSDMQTGDSNLELHGFADASETALCSSCSVLQHINITFNCYLHRNPSNDSVLVV